jgi:hypothetical protein
MPAPRASFAVVSGDNLSNYDNVGNTNTSQQAFVLGGLDEGFLPQADVFVLDVSNGTWARKKGLFSPRSSFQAAWVLDYNDDASGVLSVFAVGGNSGAAAALDVLEVMDPELDA